MAESVLQHIAAEVRDLTPYQPGRPAEEVAAERGLAAAVKLASNENPLGAGEAAQQALRSLSGEAASRYPDGGCGRLRAAVAGQLQVAPERLMFGNGSNEILELAAQAVLIPDAAAVYSRHAFAVYGLAVAARRARPVVAEATADFGHDLEAMARAAADFNARLIFVANPNNPTGSWMPSADVGEWMRQIAPDTLVVLDEAYREYTGEEENLLAADFPNLLITRTFSKIHGLAGLRVGYGIGAPELIAMLNRIRQPFNINAAAQAAALAALQDKNHVARSVKMNAAGIAQLTAGFRKMNLRFLPSRGNFLCFHPGGDAAQVYEKLLDAGVIVRPLAGYELPEWLRVTVGLEEENQHFLQALERALESAAA